MKDWSVRVSEDKNKTFLRGGGASLEHIIIILQTPKTLFFPFQLAVIAVRVEEERSFEVGTAKQPLLTSDPLVLRLNNYTPPSW